jgi:hypothetical protein
MSPGNYFLRLFFALGFIDLQLQLRPETRGLRCGGGGGAGQGMRCAGRGKAFFADGSSARPRLRASPVLLLLRLHFIALRRV